MGLHRGRHENNLAVVGVMGAGVWTGRLRAAFSSIGGSMEKKPSNASVLSIYIGSRLMPGRDGKPQRKLTVEEAERIAKKRMERK